MRGKRTNRTIFYVKNGGDEESASQMVAAGAMECRRCCRVMWTSHQHIDDLKFFLLRTRKTAKTKIFILGGCAKTLLIPFDCSVKTSIIFLASAFCISIIFFASKKFCTQFLMKTKILKLRSKMQTVAFHSQ